MASPSQTLSSTDEAETTNEGLHQTLSVHGNEHIADSHLIEDMTRILGIQPTCTFVSFVEETKLQVLVEEI